MSFDVGDASFVEDFTVCELNGFILDNTFLDYYGVEIRRGPSPTVVRVGKSGRPVPMPYTRLPMLDPSINLVRQSELGSEVYVVMMRDREYASSINKVHSRFSKHSCVDEVLARYADMLRDELPDSLPPVPDVDHKIELVPGTVPPSKPPYRLN